MLDSTFFRACEAAAIEWDVPALALGVSVGGRAETFSIGTPADTIFRIASITKPFTATLALELLDLEATTGIWASDVRIRHLLSHTSGYDCEAGDLARFGDGDDALAACVAELPGVRRYVGIEQAWSYANTGFWLAGLLAAQASGANYEEALAKHVLGPAGLESTSFGDPGIEGTGPAATGDAYPRARRPSGGLVSNVHDLLRFGEWHLAQRRAAQLRIVHGRPAAGVYGLGLFGERVGGVEVWGHGGSYGGFETSFLVIPEGHAVLAALTNSSNGGQALHSVEDAFFDRLLGVRRRPPEPLDLPVATLEGFTGSYANSDGWLDVALAPGGLAVTFEDGEFAARPIGARTFEITQGDRIRERFDFPLEGFGRFGSRLAERIA